MSDLARMTPEETRYLRKRIERYLETEARERLEHTKALMRQIARSGF